MLTAWNRQAFAEIAHRQSVGVPAKEWGSIPCFRSNAVQVGSVIEIMVNCIWFNSMYLAGSCKSDSVERHANLVVCRNGKRYIAVDSTEQDAEEANNSSVAKPIIAGSSPATTTQG